MRKNIWLPALTLLAGGAGFGLRKWQLAAGFEVSTGLAIPGAPSAAALMAFSAAVVLLLFLLTRKEEKSLAWDTLYAAGYQNSLAATALILSAVLLLASAGAEWVSQSVNGFFAVSGDTPFARIASRLLPPLRLVLCVGALPCVFLWARALLRREGGAENLATLEPCLLFCIWLISTYQLRSADPVIQDYLYEVLAIVIALLGFYFVAGPSFGNGRPRSALLFCLAGVYFSLVALADSPPLPDALRHLFAVLYLAAHALLILNHPPVEEAPAEAEREADENA